jgi:hypothetical protein
MTGSHPAGMFAVTETLFSLATRAPTVSSGGAYVRQ